MTWHSAFLKFFWYEILSNGFRNQKEHEKASLWLSGYVYWTSFHPLIFLIFPHMVTLQKLVILEDLGHISGQVIFWKNHVCYRFLQYIEFKMSYDHQKSFELLPRSLSTWFMLKKSFQNSFHHFFRQKSRL